MKKQIHIIIHLHQLITNIKYICCVTRSPKCYVDTCMWGFTQLTTIINLHGLWFQEMFFFLVLFWGCFPCDGEEKITAALCLFVFAEPGAAPGDRGGRESNLEPGCHRGNGDRGCRRASQGGLQPARRRVTASPGVTQLGELREGCHPALPG